MRYLVRLGLPIWALILIGSPPTVGADIIRTLEATSGTLRQFQDVPSGNISGPGFGLHVDRFLGSALPSVAHAGEVQPGQLVDQSGQLFLSGRAGVNGRSCCVLSGGLNISAVPSLPVPGLSGPPTLNVTAPFTASGILRGSGVFFSDEGPFGDYFFQGSGTMTSEFRASCGTVNTPSCYFWNSSVLTFGAPIPPTVPEPSTWLLLASGLVVLFLSRRRLMPPPNQPHGCSR